MFTEHFAKCSKVQTLPYKLEWHSSAQLSFQRPHTELLHREKSFKESYQTGCHICGLFYSARFAKIFRCFVVSKAKSSNVGAKFLYGTKEEHCHCFSAVLLPMPRSVV